MLRPCPGADFSNIILGLAIRPDRRHGGNVYSMCARRRNGGKLWQMDYEDEHRCEAEIDIARAVIGECAKGDKDNPFGTTAKRLIQFDEATGVVASDIDLIADKAPESIHDHVIRSAQEGSAK
jgi:hypothetical protein